MLFEQIANHASVPDDVIGTVFYLRASILLGLEAKVGTNAIIIDRAPRFQQSDMHPASRAVEGARGETLEQELLPHFPASQGYTPHESRGHGGMAGTGGRRSRG